MFAGSFAAFFLPTQYRFEAEQLVVERAGQTRSFRWDRFRSFERDRNGIFLSPHSRPHRLDTTRGVFLALSREQRDQVLAWLEGRFVERQ